MTKKFSAAYSPQRWIITGKTVVDQVRPLSGTYDIPKSNWAVQYAVRPTSITARFKAQTLEHPLQIGGQVKMNLISGEGSGSLELKPIQFAPHTLLLSQLIQPWPNPDMDLTHGTISASANVLFRKTISIDEPFQLTRIHGSVDFQELSGYFKPTTMEGLTTRIEILGEQNTFHIPSTTVRIRQIQSVIGLTDTFALLSIKPFHPTAVPTFSFRTLNTHLLGGVVSLSDLAIDPSATIHEATVQVKGMDLNEVLRLEQQEAVQGTGILDGTIPLSISGKEVTVQQGFLQCRPPGGTLQFEVDEETASSWAKTQPNLDLILNSLNNYHYSRLEVGVNYAKNGILNLATKLEGKNPDFRNGVPIRFNLNIEENIPALLKSLSLVQDLEENIQNLLSEENKAAAQK